MTADPALPRVLHVSPFASLTGANRSTLVLVEQLVQRGETHVLALQEGDFADAAREAGAQVSTVPEFTAAGRGRLSRWRLAHQAVRKLCRQHAIEIIHNNSARAVRFTYLASRLAGVKLLTHQRDIYERNSFHLGLGKSDHLIAISDFVASKLPKAWLAKTTTIYNAVDLPETVPPRTEGPLRIGAAARCVHEKGLDLLADAAIRLLPERDFELHLWGLDDNELGRSLRQQFAALPAEQQSRVSLKPFSKAIDDFYRLMDIVVVPSRYEEPFGRMAIEAMAYGRLTIVAGHGGLTEIVTHDQNGLRFAPGNVDDLVDQIKRGLGDPELRDRIGRAAVEDVRQRFTPAAHAEHVLKVYRQLTEV